MANERQQLSQLILRGYPEINTVKNEVFACYRLAAGLEFLGRTISSTQAIASRLPSFSRESLSDSLLGGDPPSTRKAVAATAAELLVKTLEFLGAAEVDHDLAAAA